MERPVTMAGLFYVAADCLYEAASAANQAIHQLPDFSQEPECPKGIIPLSAYHAGLKTDVR